MKRRLLDRGLAGRFFWLLTGLAIAIWSQVPGYVKGWDLQVYHAASESLRLGHDPYVDGMAVQEVFHREGPHPAGTAVPFTYVYSPLTLPLIRLMNLLPWAVSASLYWLVYAVSIAAGLWVCLRMVQPAEAKVLDLIAPAIVFFPALLENDVFFSGNVAYILHGMILLAAYVGWRRATWRWFYVAVVAASVFKSPLLYLLALPVLSARRQWRPAAIAAVSGAALFMLQAIIWPDTFRHYLAAVELQFSYNHDFSSSPVGLLSDALYYVIPYKLTSAVFYPICAGLIFATLFRVSRRYFLQGRITLEQWVPVLLLGVLLINPRIMEYDIAPISAAMLLVFWRFLAHSTRTTARAVFLGLVLFGLLNALAPYSWRVTACLVMVVLFVAGIWDVIDQGRREPRRKATQAGPGVRERDWTLAVQ